MLTNLILALALGLLVGLATGFVLGLREGVRFEKARNLNSMKRLADAAQSLADTLGLNGSVGNAGCQSCSTTDCPVHPETAARN
jgi:hypothetical protein